jgi:hypothetical protein
VNKKTPSQICFTLTTTTSNRSQISIKVGLWSYAARQQSCISDTNDKGVPDGITGRCFKTKEICPEKSFFLLSTFLLSPLLREPPPIFVSKPASKKRQHSKVFSV